MTKPRQSPDELVAEVAAIFRSNEARMQADFIAGKTEVELLAESNLRIRRRKRKAGQAATIVGDSD